MHNTDLAAVGCCKNDRCDWATTCCDYNPRTPAMDTWSVGTKIFTSTCGGPDPDPSLLLSWWVALAWSLTLLAFPKLTGCSQHSTSSAIPFCVLVRYENGYTTYEADFVAGLTQSIHFTSGAQTTAWPGLPRLTGKNGPPPPALRNSGTTTATATKTVLVTSTATGTNAPSPGVVAGSVVGGAALGAIVTLLVLLLTWYTRNRGSTGRGRQKSSVGGSESASMVEHREEAAAASVQVEAGDSPAPMMSAVSQMTPADAWLAPGYDLRTRDPIEVGSIGRYEMALENGRWELAAR